MNNKSTAKKLGLVFLLSLGTMGFFFYRSDGRAAVQVLKSADLQWVFIGLLSFLGYCGFQGLAFFYMLRQKKYPVSFKRTIGYSLADSFFSNITPGGSGGQPGQFYFMHRDRISTAHGMTALFAFNAMYHIAMLCFAGLSWGMGITAWVEQVSSLKPVIVYGIGAQVVFSLVLIGAIYFPQGVKKAADIFFFPIKKTRWKDRGIRWEEKWIGIMEDYRKYGEDYRKHPFLFLPVFFCALGVLFCLYAITYCAYRAIGENTYSLFQIIGLQGVISLAVESLPLPGGVGVSEGALLKVTSSLVSPGAALGWMVLARTLSFFTGLFFGGMVVAFMNRRGLGEMRKKSLEKLSRTWKPKPGKSRKAIAVSPGKRSVEWGN